MGDQELDVSACLERVRQRDQDAARDLTEHLYPLVIKIVRSHLPDEWMSRIWHRISF